MDEELLRLKVGEIVVNLVNISEIARRDGLLSLEDRIDRELIRERDPFNIGLQLVVDGTDWMYINEYLNNLIETDVQNDWQGKLIYRLYKQGLRSIQSGDNSRILIYMLDSLIPKKYRPEWMADGYTGYLKASGGELPE